MPFADFWLSLEMLPFTQEIGATAWFPFIESIHVLSITLMLGAILMVDLRVLGLAAKSYPVSTMARELVPWSGIAFLLATATGVAMFMTRAASHVDNTAFQIKMVLLLLGGINILVFHTQEKALLQSLDVTFPVPLRAKVCAGISLFVWVGAMVAGRWVGHLI